MSVYIISYDLIDEKNYTRIIEKIKEYPWAKPLESFWLVKTNNSASHIRDSLTKVVDNDDKIIVIEAGKNWATRHIPKEVTDWIKDNI